MSAPRSLPWPALAAGLAAACALVFGVYHFVPGLALLGWDGWPLVAAGRIDGPGDVLRPFTEELMAGRYPYGHFYRPLVHLSFGLDHALAGLDPAGYHRTDLAWLALATFLAGCVAARSVPARRALAGAVAGVAFALHPVQLELVTVSPRRADTMAVALVLACACVVRDRASLARRAALLILAFAAAASKETGVLAAPLTAVAAWCAAPRAGVRSALRASAPAWVGVLALVAARTAVLGGLGGHTGPAQEAVGLFRRWGDLFTGALLPRPLLGEVPGWLPVAFGLALLAAPFAVWGDRRLAVLSFAWALAVLAIVTLAERSHEWYAMLLVVPFALLAGGAAAAARGRALPLAGLLLALVASWVASSPLARAPHPLRAASEAARWTLATLERELGDAPGPGARAVLDPWLPMLRPAEGGGGVRALHIADAYTLQAWCELRWPGVPFAVVPLRGAPLPVAPDRVLVELRYGPEPAWIADLRGGE